MPFSWGSNNPQVNPCPNCNAGAVECSSCSSGSVTCTVCKGKRIANGQNCGNCGATGKVDCDNCDGTGFRVCGTCGGSGSK